MESPVVAYRKHATSSSSSSSPMIIPAKHSVSRSSFDQKKPRSIAIPPRTAAILAATAIPSRRRSKRTKLSVNTTDLYGPRTPPSSTAFDDVAILDDADTESFSSLSVRTAMEVLLSPPDSDDDFSGSFLSRTPSSSSSCDSESSAPGLETDTESTCGSITSSWSSNTSRRELRKISSPTEECSSSHPLLSISSSKETKTTPRADIQPDALTKRVTRRNHLTLVSNLTASLKAAAKSFSSLTAITAGLHSEDYLTRSLIITPRSTDERRPPVTHNEPSPALRRYLNPWSTTHEELPTTGMVMMQTYTRNSPASKGSGRSRRNRNTQETEEENCVCAPIVKQREQRENSDFLRVVVLEMNMRRSGKLDGNCQGRARYSLPARRGEGLRRRMGPQRWRVITGEV
ncbi:hypothetical protein BZA77DRAFT_313233 [Pyronema omphalodes]|nr:hypothetical protein BZA77DRAFT_313233 [Pyronema omphalodes]